MADPIDVPANSPTAVQVARQPVQQPAQAQSVVQPVVKKPAETSSVVKPKTEKKLSCMWWFWLIIGLIAGAGLSAVYFLFFS